MVAVAAKIEAGLRAASNPERAVNEKRYLKSDLEFLGAGVPAIRRVTKASLRPAPDLTGDELLDLVADLWGRGTFELRAAAVEALALRNELLDPASILAIEPLLREAKTWALIDSLATKVIAPLLERHAGLVATLDRWAEDDDFWIRRTAMLALLPALRRGGGDFARFARYAEAVVEEREFFIRKAIGWILREVSKKRPALVSDWLAPRTGRASGVTMREAVKYLPSADRERLMAAYRERRPA